ncbi:MAG: serine/threonine protein kinase [Gemmataceae bacterium]|nr:serine/threonine protein kinase [Gemmataceae bacterium]
MSQRLSCPNGHSWDPSSASSGDAASCPVCGSWSTQGPPDDDATATLMINTSTGFGGDVPPTIPEFRIQGELGRGGMGIVYKAKQIAEDRIVALKVIRKDRLQHDEAVRRFRREAQAAARLQHPNIVRLYDSDNSGDTHFLAMEYVAGITLEKFVELNGPAPYELACSILRQAALGLQHALEQGLVHRDIKPSNLMITPATGRTDDGTPAEVKILDMGVARVLHGDNLAESLSTLTQGGSVIGTADYVAPEQLEDPHGADIRADLYSLGCTFYYLLIGKVPFPGGSLVSKLDKQRWQMPTPIGLMRPDVPPAVAELAAKLMAKKPDDRYASPADLVLAVDELLRTDYASSEPAGPIPRELKRWLAHQEGVWCVAFGHDSKAAVSSGKDRLVKLWDVQHGELTRVFARQAQDVRALAFSPAGDRIAGGVGVSIRIWDLAGNEIRRLSGHTSAIRSLCFHPEGNRLFSASDDKTIRVWDLLSFREVQRFTRHSSPVTGIALQSGEDVLLSGGRDQAVRVWDLRSGQQTRSWLSGAAVLGLSLSGDGRRVASANFDTVVRIWDVATGNALGELQGHKQMVSSVAFLPDGETLLTTSQDHTLKWWDAVTGCEIASLALHKGGIQAFALAPSGALALTGGGDGTLCLVEIPQRT